MDQLDPFPVSDSEQPNSQTKETPAQPPPYRLQSNSPATSVFVEVPSLKRKRSSRLSSSKPEPDHPSQPPVDGRANEPSSRTPQLPKRWRIDCVLITTLPPVPHKKTAPPEPSEDEGDRSLTKTRMRSRQKKKGKQREAAPTTRSSVLTNSRSHSVSSLRPPLFEPVSIDLFQMAGY